MCMSSGTGPYAGGSSRGAAGSRILPAITESAQAVLTGAPLPDSAADLGLAPRVQVIQQPGLPPIPAMPQLPPMPAMPAAQSGPAARSALAGPRATTSAPTAKQGGRPSRRRGRDGMGSLSIGSTQSASGAGLNITR